jgi:aryl-alcohol dehydrogenase (NADP+)
MARIGSSDLDVYPLNLGGNTFGWTSDAAESFAVLDAFVSAGGNFIDTSDSYMASAPGNVGGESETILGEWFTKRGRRDDIVLATKVSRHPEFLGLAPDNIARAAEASLRRLKTDHIDLYYAHYDDPDVPLADTLGAFDALVKAGKVRHVGISNYSAERIKEWIDVAEANRFAKPIALQPHYSLVARQPFEDELRPLAEEFGLASSRTGPWQAGSSPANTAPPGTSRVSREARSWSGISAPRGWLWWMSSIASPDLAACRSRPSPWHGPVSSRQWLRLSSAPGHPSS